MMSITVYYSKGFYTNIDDQYLYYDERLVCGVKLGVNERKLTCLSGLLNDEVYIRGHFQIKLASFMIMTLSLN